MSRLRLAFALLGVCSLTLGSISAASAGARTQSKYGGTIVVAQSIGIPLISDPTLSVGGPSAEEIFSTICEGLYDVDGRGQIVPLLATALPTISKDKLTYTIPLRKGILFNDGTPFNAQAVVTTLERDLTLPASLRAGDLASVSNVSAMDSSTVVIHLKEPFTPLTANLTSDAGRIMSPAQLAKLGDNFGTDPVCVGPFMFDSQVAGASVTVIKSPYYYDKYRVFLDKIVFQSATDAAAASASLRAGDIQAIDSVSTTQLPGITGDSSLAVLSEKTVGYSSIVFNIGNRNGSDQPYTNLGTSLTSNPNVRKAFEEAIDRTALNKVVFGGRMQAGCTPISPASPWFDATIPCTPYNPTDARKLLAAAGSSNLTVHLLTKNTTDDLRLAQFIQAEEAAVGIDIVIDPIALLKAQTQSGNFQAYLIPPAGSVDPEGILRERYGSEGAGNTSGYENPRVDLLLANGRKALTVKARRTLYHALQIIVANDRPVIYLYHIVKFSAFDTSLTGLDLRPDGVLRVAFAQHK
jgi:peptide/nickel transport system substrate-binding protein